MEDQFISIEEFFKVLKKRWRIITVSFMFFVAIAIVLSFFIITPKYEATTKLFIGKRFNGENQEYSPNDVLMYQNLMKTYSEIIKTPDILLKCMDKSNINSSLEDVISKLDIIAISDTQILQVKYRSEDANKAMDFIDNLNNEFINISEKLIPNGNVEILQSVRLPENAVSPNKKINIIIGAFIGLVLGVALAFLSELLDKKIRCKADLEKIINTPIIGVIPLVISRKMRE